MTSEPLVPYSTCHHQMKTGDVVIFSSDDLPATVVKVATSSKYVHAAIVLFSRQSKTPDYSVIIAESHIKADVPSLGTGDSIVGVQHQWLDQRLASCQGPVWWVPLKAPLLHEKRQQMQAWLQEMEAKRIPYDFWQVIGAGVDIGDTLGLENTPNDEALFCSELVTRALQVGEAIDGDINPAEQVPADIIEFPCFQPPVLIKTP